MIETYLSAYMHPGRVGDILSVVNDLSHLGLDQAGQAVESLIMSGSVSGSDGVIGDIEQVIEVALTAAFRQFGVDIDYDDSQIPEQLELLNFLAQWDTEEGYGPSSVNLPDGIDELGSDNVDRLRELFALAIGDPSHAYIDWLVGVEGYLIKVINATLTADDEDDSPDEEAGLIIDSILSPFRSFSAHYQASAPVRYVAGGGSIGINFAQLIEANGAQFNVNDEPGYAADVVGFALLSDMPRENLQEAIAHFIELTYGPADIARRVIMQAQTILTNIGLSN